MKTLAESFVVAYEGSSPSSKLGTFESLNLNALKAVKSTIAVGFVAVGVFAGTAVQAETVQKALSYGDRGLVVAALQSKLGGVAVDGIFGSQTLTKLKSYQAVNKLAVDGVATKETLASLGTPNLAQAAPQPEQYGKLKLINDQPRPMIIYLKKQGNESYSRYAYLRGCTERTLQAQYSSSWMVSNDLGSWHNVQDHKNQIYNVTASSLETNNQGGKCLGYSQLEESLRKEGGVNNGQRATQVINLNFGKLLPVISEGIAKSSDAAEHLAQRGIKPTVELFEKNAQNLKGKKYISPEYQEVVRLFKQTPEDNQVVAQLIKGKQKQREELISSYLRLNGDTQNLNNIENFINTNLNEQVLSRTPPNELKEQLIKFFKEKCGYSKYTSEVVNSLLISALTTAKLSSLIEMPKGNSVETIPTQEILAKGEVKPQKSLEALLTAAGCMKGEKFRNSEMVVSLAPRQEQE
jgi:hypothetical protein